MIVSMLVSNGTLARFKWLRCGNEALVTEMCRRDAALHPMAWGADEAVSHLGGFWCCKIS
jgi:hypothetical protein